MCNNNLTLLLLHSNTTLVNFSLLNFLSSNSIQLQYLWTHTTKYQHILEGKQKKNSKLLEIIKENGKMPV